LACGRSRQHDTYQGMPFRRAVIVPFECHSLRLPAARAEWSGARLFRKWNKAYAAALEALTPLPTSPKV
jgi:hypothetical protein